MANRTNLYFVCLILFPLAFAAFVVGFGCPVWQASSDTNSGLWQSCQKVFKSCTTFDFDEGGDWLIGVRAVEIFALVMLTVAGINITYENFCTNFKGRQLSERLAVGVLCILGGLGGIAGAIVYAVETDDLPISIDYGWAFALMAGGSGLAVCVGVGFCVSGCCFEPKKKHDHPKGQVNGRTPHRTSNDESYEINAFTNKSMFDDRGRPQPDSLPGFAMYNGMLNQPGQRNSLPVGMSTGNVPPPYSTGGKTGPSMMPKGSQYYSVSDDRILDPTFDLSEGFSYKPRSATRMDNGRAGRGEDPYTRGADPYVRGADPYSRGGRPEDPYYRGGREEDPYNRAYRAPRAGYNDPYGFDRQPTGRGGPDDLYDRANYGRGNEVSRDSYYRAGRF